MEQSKDQNNNFFPFCNHHIFLLTPNKMNYYIQNLIKITGVGHKLVLWIKIIRFLFGYSPRLTYLCCAASNFSFPNKSGYLLSIFYEAALDLHWNKQIVSINSIIRSGRPKRVNEKSLLRAPLTDWIILKPRTIIHNSKHSLHRRSARLIYGIASAASIDQDSQIRTHGAHNID